MSDELEIAELSPDGSEVAGYLSPRGGSLLARLTVIGTDGQSRRTIYQAPAGRTITEVTWSPDGKLIAFTLGAYMGLGGPGTGPMGYPLRQEGSGAACGTPAGPEGYGATTANDGEPTARLTVYPCKLLPGERPDIQAAVDSPWTIILAAHLDYGDGTGMDITYDPDCDRDGGLMSVKGDKKSYAQPGQYLVTATVTTATCTEWGPDGQVGPTKTVNLSLPILHGL